MSSLRPGGGGGRGQEERKQVGGPEGMLASGGLSPTLRSPATPPESVWGERGVPDARRTGPTWSVAAPTPG